MNDKEELIRKIAFMIADRENLANNGVSISSDNPKIQKYVPLAEEILNLVSYYKLSLTQYINDVLDQYDELS